LKEPLLRKLDETSGNMTAAQILAFCTSHQAKRHSNPTIAIVQDGNSSKEHKKRKVDKNQIRPAEKKKRVPVEKLLDPSYDPMASSTPPLTPATAKMSDADGRMLTTNVSSSPLNRKQKAYRYFDMFLADAATPDRDRILAMLTGSSHVNYPPSCIPSSCSADKIMNSPESCNRIPAWQRTPLTCGIVLSARKSPECPYSPYDGSDDDDDDDDIFNIPPLTAFSKGFSTGKKSLAAETPAASYFYSHHNPPDSAARFNHGSPLLMKLECDNEDDFKCFLSEQAMEGIRLSGEEDENPSAAAASTAKAVRPRTIRSALTKAGVDINDSKTRQMLIRDMASAIRQQTGQLEISLSTSLGGNQHQSSTKNQVHALRQPVIALAHSPSVQVFSNAAILNTPLRPSTGPSVPAMAGFTFKKMVSIKSTVFILVGRHTSSRCCSA
jgi:hypothetical protein